MADITAGMVKQLREMTDCGMMDCKKALVEVSGDMDAAVEYLRKKGLSKAAKKADRIATEGTIAIDVSDDFKKATITEINSETDFVSKNENFQALAAKTSGHIHSQNVESVEDLMKTTIDGTHFEEYLNAQIARIGENIVLRRFASITTDAGGAVNGYLHSNGRVGVLVAAKCDSDATAKAVSEALREIAMHAAAMRPTYLNEAAVPQIILDKEVEIAKELLKKEGKPEKIWDKIIPGKINKYYEDQTLVNQKFVKDDKKAVKQYLSEVAKENGGTAELVDFIRFELGEGLEKKNENFAAEVAAQMS